MPAEFRRHYGDRQAGAANAGIFAAQIVARKDAKVAAKLSEFKRRWPRVSKTETASSKAPNEAQ
jgi:phosphoribosylcarboxyaminoimidazole (NCAIR) mutase